MIAESTSVFSEEVINSSSDSEIRDEAILVNDSVELGDSSFTDEKLLSVTDTESVPI